MSVAKSRAIILSFILLLIPALYVAGLLTINNFHEVVPGEFYRSSQLSGAQIRTLAKFDHIRTIINLRGAHVGSHWYDEEKIAAAKSGITLIDFKISSREKLTKPRLDELLEILKSSPKPLLVHCSSGSDRTGLVAAIYLAAIKHDSEFTAELQLSPAYGHFPVWFMHGYAMDQSFEDFEPLFGYEDS